MAPQESDPLVASATPTIFRAELNSVAELNAEKSAVVPACHATCYPNGLKGHDRTARGNALGNVKSFEPSPEGAE